MSSDEAFLAALAEALTSVGLDAIVVGMTAAALQGAPVMTEDVDLLIRKTQRNREKVDQLCAALGDLSSIRASELADVETLLGGDVPIDILFDHLPGKLRFAALKSRAVEVRVGRRSLRVAALEDVIRSKEAADRPKDRAALPMLREALRVIQELKKKPR